MSRKSPMQVVLERFGKVPAKDADRAAKREAKDSAKKALVAKLSDLLDRPEGEDKEAFEKRLSFVPNRKLLGLLSTQERLKKDFGTKANLIEAILANQKRSKDEDFRKKLQTMSAGRLLTIAPKTK